MVFIVICTNVLGWAARAGSRWRFLGLGKTLQVVVVKQPYLRLFTLGKAWFVAITNGFSWAQPAWCMLSTQPNQTNNLYCAAVDPNDKAKPHI
jgi:hypothetical protein